MEDFSVFRCNGAQRYLRVQSLQYSLIEGQSRVRNWFGSYCRTMKIILLDSFIRIFPSCVCEETTFTQMGLCLYV